MKADSTFEIMVEALDIEQAALIRMEARGPDRSVLERLSWRDARWIIKKTKSEAVRVAASDYLAEISAGFDKSKEAWATVAPGSHAQAVALAKMVEYGVFADWAELTRLYSNDAPLDTIKERLMSLAAEPSHFLFMCSTSWGPVRNSPLTSEERQVFEERFLSAVRDGSVWMNGTLSDITPEFRVRLLDALADQAKIFSQWLNIWQMAFHESPLKNRAEQELLAAEASPAEIARALEQVKSPNPLHDVLLQRFRTTNCTLEELLVVREHSGSVVDTEEFHNLLCERICSFASTYDDWKRLYQDKRANGRVHWAALKAMVGLATRPEQLIWLFGQLPRDRCDELKQQILDDLERIGTAEDWLAFKKSYGHRLSRSAYETVVRAFERLYRQEAQDLDGISDNFDVAFER